MSEQTDTVLLLDRQDTSEDNVIHTICYRGECGGDWSFCGVPRLDRRILTGGNCPDCLYHKENGTHVG